MIELETILQTATEIEPLPATVSRLACIVSQDDVDLREVVEVVSYDQALTGRILKTANSALSAGRVEIKTVKDAVVRLGSGLVLSFAIGQSVKKRMKSAVPEYGMLEGELWKHSVATAVAAEFLKPRCRASNPPPEAFTAALLHDIGKLVMARALDAETLRRLADAGKQDEQALLRAEELCVGVNHAELGGHVARSWKLSETIVVGIGFHHDPSAAGTALPRSDQPPGNANQVIAIASLVHVSNLVAEHALAEATPAQLEAGESEHPPGNHAGPVSRVESNAMKALGLDEIDLVQATEVVNNKLDDILTRFD